MPILLLKESVPTQKQFWEILEQPKNPPSAQQAAEDSSDPDRVDPFVQEAISATGGNLYRSSVNNLRRYPIPELPLPGGGGKCFLDLGCNWGRWCVSAGRKGYSPIGIDPNPEAVLAARRVSKQLGVSAYFLVADARHLPFSENCADVVFSYSVLQHFDKNDVRQTLREIARILKTDGSSLIQMPNAMGPHNLIHQLREGLRKPREFAVRYWTPSELRRVFGSCIGPTSLSADGYFSLNPQPIDLDILPFRQGLVVKTSEALRRFSLRWAWLVYGADSLYVRSSRPTRVST